MSRVYDGRDMLPVLSGQSKGPLHKTFYWQSRHDDKWAVRHGDWKLIAEDNLYNLKDDIGETKNLAGENPEVVKKLETLMRVWRSTMEAETATLLSPKP